MIAILAFDHGRTIQTDHVEPAWLEEGATVRFWVDVTSPTDEDGRLLSELFHFHPLSVEDALSTIQFPKVEQYDDYLYMVLHGIDFRKKQHHFATLDVDFFLGRNYLVTVHTGESRSVKRITELCARRENVLAEGPVALLHRIVDAMVDNYRPEIDALEARISKLEEQAFTGRDNIVKSLLQLKRDLSSLRRVVIPQRDAIGRLARREFGSISEEMTYRFRDVYDHLVRISDEATIFQDRVNGILEAHLSAVSNRLNEVMKVLTVMSTIFLPLTVLTGMWGMNIRLPYMPGGEAAQFWWIGAMMAAVVVVMLAYFKRRNWL
ncbi:MAG: magnesium/cobalt transporter CorA [Vicinamibacterales bacterium]